MHARDRTLRRRIRHHGAHNNTERWLLTYSDLITLLLIFFVVMYSITSVNISKFHQLAESLNQSMGATNTLVATPSSAGSRGVLQNQTVLPPLTPAERAVAMAAVKEAQAFDRLLKRLRRYLLDHHLQAKIQAVQQTRGIQITLRDNVLFATGSDRLSVSALGILRGLVPFLETVNNPIVVEGYTDSVPIRTAQFPSNWFLSVDRAAQVVQDLVSAGIPPLRIAATGYSKYHPVATNATHAGRQANRRVNIVILRRYPTTGA